MTRLRCLFVARCSFWELFFTFFFLFLCFLWSRSLLLSANTPSPFSVRAGCLDLDTYTGRLDIFRTTVGPTNGLVEENGWNVQGRGSLSFTLVSHNFWRGYHFFSLLILSFGPAAFWDAWDAVKSLGKISQTCLQRDRIHSAL